MDNNSAERLEKMESHIATLERQVEQLNEVVIEQSHTIGKLKTQVQRLTQSVESAEMERIKSTNVKPPHY